MTPTRSTRSPFRSPKSVKSPKSAAYAVLALAAGASLALTSCSGGAAESDGGTLKVVATTTQLTDFVAQIGGDDVDVTGLLPAGGSAHSFDPSPADLLALGEADVLVVNGAGLETFIDDAVDASGFDGETITASEGIDLDEAKAITAEIAEGGEAVHDEHAHEGEDPAHEEPGHDEHAEEGHAEEGHDHGDVNPHIWTSPRYAEGMVTMIAGDLARIDPERAEGYTERADAYAAKLDELDAWIAAQFERVPEADRVLVSGHDSLSYYLHDYGIAFAGSILPSFEDNAQPSAAEVDALVQAIRDRGVKAVFVESSMSPKLAQTIAQEAGVEVVDAETLYADSLGAPDSGADTYIDATVHNTTVILEAWGVDPEEPPATLQG